MRRLPPLTAVRVFEASARHENFTQAASELGMTQAAVSYQIRLLEERLGMPLFIRAKGRVSLSEAGRRLAPAITTAFDSLGEAFSALHDDSEGVLSITTSQTFAVNWLATRLGDFQIRHPELAVRIDTSNRMLDFAREDVDLGIRMGHAPWPGLRHHFLFNLHSAPICSPAFRDAHPMAHPRDLLNVTRLSPGDEWWTHWLAEEGVEDGERGRSLGLRLDSQAAEGQAALAGHGVAMLTPLYWKADMAAGRLVQLFPRISLEGRAIWLVYPEHKRNQKKVPLFRDWLLAEIAKEIGYAPPEVFTAPLPA